MLIRCGVLVVVILVATSRGAPQKGNKQKPGVVSTTPASSQQQESSAVMASQIVQELKTLAHRHKLPAVLHDVTNVIPYGQEDDYDHFDNEHEIFKLHDEEPTADPALSPSGFNVKGVLGLVEYLILLILLKGSINHIAERYNKYRARRGARSADEDLTGLAEEMQHHTTNHDLDQRLSRIDLNYKSQYQSRKNRRKTMKRE